MDITSNPLIVTAADVAAGPVTVWVGLLHVMNVEFSKYVGINDNAILNQGNGKFFAYLSAASDLEAVKTNNIMWARGLVVPQLGITNGQLAIYIK